MKSRKENNPNPLWVILVLIAGTVVIIGFAPGMAILAALNYYAHLNLDKLHIWGFSTITSLIIFFAFYMTGKKGFKPALLNYVLLSFSVIGLTIYLVYRYGAPLYEVIYADFFGVVNKI